MLDLIVLSVYIADAKCSQIEKSLVALIYTVMIPGNGDHSLGNTASMIGHVAFATIHGGAVKIITRSFYALRRTVFNARLADDGCSLILKSLLTLNYIIIIPGTCENQFGKKACMIGDH